MPLLRFLGAKLRGGAVSAARSRPAITDAQFARSLGAYAGMVDRVLDQPERWLGVDPPTGVRSVPRKVLDRLRHTVSGDQHPGSAGWDREPLAARTEWWLDRIALTAGVAAAAPRLAGLLADRIPLQAALSASASGLAVCAVARENGVDDPEAWVPLLARVVFERDLAPQQATVPDKAESERALTEAADDESEPPSALAQVGEGGRRAVRGMWRLARVLLELEGIFDDRPRGGLLPRVVARLPVVGVAGGWLDERGAIRSAARETQQLLDARTG